MLGIPLIVTLLPLSTKMYGKVDDDSPWCFICNRSDSPEWEYLFGIQIIQPLTAYTPSNHVLYTHQLTTHYKHTI